MAARVETTDTALAEIHRLPPTIAGRVQNVLARLERWPEVSGAKPMHGDLAGAFRIRTGDWRVLFRPSAAGDVVTVFRVANRRDVYED